MGCSFSWQQRGKEKSRAGGAINGGGVDGATLARLTPRMLTEAPTKHFHMKAASMAFSSGGNVGRCFVSSAAAQRLDR